MGIHGILKEIGPGQRISLAKVSSDHYIAHNRPFRLAIDISIWLFQIQSGKGGSNPALRTFYYRLLRLLTLNIHPLFVFDGPNKPLFKRNKKVGGPGVRVASVPEFLAKQLLKQFGFPWHVAPGEAEAECALLQGEGLVDVVLSEDVDTLMFGSGVTLRNWTSENSTKSPTHVNVYRKEETKAKSGLDRQGMILVALMSGGDYLPEGIPGCGPKVACDAARAGFGKDLCALGKKDAAGLRLWKDRLQHQIRTNEAKYFSRKNNGFTMPEDFPNPEVLGYYTHPCVSTPEKLTRLREALKWDQDIDFAALRSFASDAFDWRCLGGAKKFIKNLAPAMLIRELRLEAETQPEVSQEAQEERELQYVKAIHGKRNHSTTDGELEYRISFTPATLVPIDLSLEEEDHQFLPAGGEDSEAESEFAALPSSTAPAADGTESDVPLSPTKKRQFKPYDPDQPEKLWVLRTFLQIGCPLLVEEYEASFRDPKEFLKARRKARAAAKGGEGNIHAPKPKKAAAGKKKAAASDAQQNSLTAYTKVTKNTGSAGREPLKETSSQGNASSQPKAVEREFGDEELKSVSGFRLPATQVPKALLDKYIPEQRQRTVEVEVTQETEYEVVDLLETPRPFARFTTKAVNKPAAAQKQPAPQPKPKPKTKEPDGEKTPPRRKRRSPSISCSPAVSQRTITSYYSPSPRKPKRQQAEAREYINLISSSPAKHAPVEDSRPPSPSPPNLRHQFIRSPEPDAEAEPPLMFRSGVAQFMDFSPGKLPDTVTKRRRKGPLRRQQTAPARIFDGPEIVRMDRYTFSVASPVDAGKGGTGLVVEAMDLASPSPARLGLGGGGFLVGDECEEEGENRGLPSPSLFVEKLTRLGKESERLSQGSPFDEPRSSYPTPPTDDEEELAPPPMPPPPATVVKSKPTAKPAKSTKPTKPSSSKAVPAPTQPPRRSPRQQNKKKAIQLRQSLEGAWKEVDLTDDGSGWKHSNGRAKIAGGWRKSGVEVLDLTGA